MSYVGSSSRKNNFCFLLSLKEIISSDWFKFSFKMDGDNDMLNTEISEEQNMEQIEHRPLLPPHTQQATKALGLLLLFSFFMFSLPFGAFFGVQHFLKFHLHITGFTNTVWSVFAAVITVNLIIMGYAYIAYHEQEYDDEGNPIVESKEQPRSKSD